jgi:hypothetical protein
MLGDDSEVASGSDPKNSEYIMRRAPYPTGLIIHLTYFNDRGRRIMVIFAVGALSRVPVPTANLRYSEGSGTDPAVICRLRLSALTDLLFRVVQSCHLFQACNHSDEEGG